VRAVDEAVMQLLRDDDLTVFDGFVPVDTTSKVVAFELPFIVYYGAPGVEEGRRLTGRRGLRTVGFMVTFVGIDRNQAKWAGEKARTVLSRTRLTIDGRKTGLVDVLTSPWVWRDDDMLQPDGKPVFYGRDTYEVPLIHLPTMEGP
jgi:hypothetical protein